jgi:small-conductance mechanosensitive channel
VTVSARLGWRPWPWRGLLVLLGCLLLSPAALAQTRPAPPTAASEAGAAVEVDGRVLFHVRGIEAYPAAQRAANVGEKIEALAADPAFRPGTLATRQRGDITEIVGGSRMVMGVTEVDAEAEDVPAALLAQVYAERIDRAIVEHRRGRTPQALAASFGRAAAALTIAVLAFGGLLWLLGRGEALVQRAFDRRVAVLTTESRRMRGVAQLWRSLRGVLSMVRWGAAVVVLVFLAEYVLLQFPWTYGAGRRLSRSVAEPIARFVDGFVAAIPNLVLLALLFFVTRFGLSLTRLYFEAIEDGSITVRRFEREWAEPTFNLVRFAAVAMALVIAYPLIPGSDTEAFKGLSILAGVMLSLGSSAAVANIVAGYMILYRRAFRVGDRVRIGAVIGDVTDVRMMVTHVRTVKNEEVTIPNSSILGSEVTNFSLPAREGGLILHTEVGIGYDTPWRLVEALLIEAARLTPGLLPEPPPFVLQRELGVFAVVYEINGYSDQAASMPRIYADLHRNILDQFNSHGVQIMTPAYEGDPEQPKVVVPERWRDPPARQEAG